MKKRLLSILLVAAMACSLLAGCGQTEKAPAAEGAATEEAAEETAEETAEIEECTLDFYSWMAEEAHADMFASFMEKYPQVKVVDHMLDGGQYRSLLMPMILNGDCPDVFLVMPSMVKNLAKEGFIAPITDYPGVAEQAENVPAINNELSYNGEVYGYVVNANIGAGYIYYEKNFFAENNLEIPTTMEEFEALCEKIKALGVDPLISAAGSTWASLYPVQNNQIEALANYGEFDGSHAAQAALLNGEIKMSDIYGDEFRKLAEWVDNGWFSETALSMDWQTAAQFFVDGGAAMYVGTATTVSADPIEQNTNEDFELGAFPLPAYEADDGKYYTSCVPDRVLVVSASTENPEAAKALFEHFTSEEELVKYLNTQNLVGINVENELNPITGPVIEELMDTSKYQMAYTTLTYMPTGWSANLGQYGCDVYAGTDPEELLSKLDADFETAASAVDIQELLDQLQ